MRIALTGASGLVGRRSVSALMSAGHSVVALGRAPRPGLAPGAEFAIWDPERPGSAAVLEGIDAVVHLAGEPVAQRWSQEVKRRIRSSRVDGTLRLVDAMARCERGPRVLVSASAVGYYGNRGGEQLLESAEPGRDFLAGVCVDWERAARSAESVGARVAVLRLGMVLAREGGALARMLPAFRFGMGGRLGSGDQYMAWIHIADLVAVVQWALDNHAATGAFNATSPFPVTNADFTHALGRALGRPAVLPVPRAALKLLFGEMSEIMLHSQRVLPDAARRAGFHFQHPEIFAALKDLLR